MKRKWIHYVLMQLYDKWISYSLVFNKFAKEMLLEIFDINSWTIFTYKLLAYLGLHIKYRNLKLCGLTLRNSDSLYWTLKLNIQSATRTEFHDQQSSGISMDQTDSQTSLHVNQPAQVDNNALHFSSHNVQNIWMYECS